MDKLKHAGPLKLMIRRTIPFYLGERDFFSWISQRQLILYTEGFGFYSGSLLVRKAVQAQGIKSRNVRNYLCILEGIYQKQYASCLSRWNRFCTSKNSDPLRPAVALVLGCLTKWLDEGLGYSTITRHAVQFLPLHVPAGSPSRGGDVAVHTFYINQPSLPTPFYSVLVSISVFLALSTVSPYVVLCG